MTKPRVTTSIFFFAFTAGAWVSACSGGGSSGDALCSPGLVRQCTCPGGEVGTQGCAGDGPAWGPCQCGAVATGGEGGSGSPPAGGGEAGQPASGSGGSAEGGTTGMGGAPEGTGGEGTGGDGLGGAPGAGGDGVGGDPGTGGDGVGGDPGTGGDGIGGDPGTGGDGVGGDPGTGGNGIGGDPGTGGDGVGGNPGTGGDGVGGGAGATVVVGDSGVIPDDGGSLIYDWDVSGVMGWWFTFIDTGGSTLVPAYPDAGGEGPFGSQNGEMCFSGTAVGHEGEYYDTNWGAGIGFAVCAYPEDISWMPADLQAAGSPEQTFSASNCPTQLTGVSSISFTLSGVWPEMRLMFRSSHTYDLAPFVVVESAGVHTFVPSQAEVPAAWDEPNAGEIGSTDVLEISFQVTSVTDTVGYDFCISDITIN